MKRIIIGGTKSGCGKTTVTCALLAALKRRNINVSAFKCGPDYIDPMFHRKVIGVESHNLDSFFFDRNTILNLLGEYGKKSDISVIEGVMGFYDGSCGSAYSVSELTETPVVMVIDCKGMSDSIGAVMSGFLNYRKNRISGFIFDRLPEKLIPLAQKLCCELGTEYFGCLPKCGASIESRHLGLVTADEIADIQTKLERLGELAEKYILIDKLINSCDVPLPEYNPLDIPQFDEHPTIAAARDSAFCFIYQENIELLEKMGCRIIYFSPLKDSAVPKADGLLLYGGYPELYAQQLEDSLKSRQSVADAVRSGMPTIAECGGFQYLGKKLCGKTMCGVLGHESSDCGRLVRFGYVTLTSKKDGLLGKAGTVLKGHELHYYDSTDNGADFTARKVSGKAWDCVVTTETLYAGYPHLYLPSSMEAVEAFYSKCLEYKEAHHDHP